MISFEKKKKRNDHTASCSRGSRKLVSLTSKFQSSLSSLLAHPTLLPPVACECLAAINAASLGSGVKAKTALCSDKWARQDIFTETLPKPLAKLPLMRIIFLSVCLQVGNEPQIRGIFSSYSPCLPARSDQILYYLCQMQGTYPKHTTHNMQAITWGFSGPFNKKEKKVSDLKYTAVCLHHWKLQHNMGRDFNSLCVRRDPDNTDMDGVRAEG